MTAGRADARARRYLLGEADDQASAALEEGLFHDEGAIEHMEAAEEALIEDYVCGRLSADERARFEQHYLAAPHHRVRVDTVRRLMAAASNEHVHADRRVRAGAGWMRWYGAGLAAAASLILIVGTLWFYFARAAHNPPPADRSAQAGVHPRDRNLPAPAPAPRIFATSLSPIALRSVDAGPALVIPAGTDVVSLWLNGEGELPQAGAARAIVRTVAGDTIWQGAAIVGHGLPRGTVARIDVPAVLLHPDDYVVELRTGPAGADRERYRYVLRVRSR